MFHSITFKSNTTYTITHEYNGPGVETRKAGLSAAEASARFRFLRDLHAADPFRKDWVVIEGSDGSSRHVFF